MGSNFSKSDNSSMESSQNTTTENLTLESSFQSSNVAGNVDPRSPTTTVCRTPINKFLERQNKPFNQNISPNTTSALKDCESPKTILKSKFLKEINSKLIDPRSPNPFINRTPIVFDDSSNHVDDESDKEIDKSIDLDDTFSDLFVDKSKNDLQLPSTSSSLVNENLEVTNSNSANDVVDVRDPRSPSFGVERTPIIFSDDSNDENEMIENFLDVLKIDMAKKNKNSELNMMKKTKNNFKVTQNIYEDNVISSLKCSTPKRSGEEQQNKVPKRTPLSCMGNISHIKGKSIDNQTKLLKFSFNNLAMMKHSAVEEIGTVEKK